MSITRINDTRGISPIKARGTSVSDVTNFIGQVDQGDLILANGELFYKAERNSTTGTPVGQGLVATGSITSAEILALNATPKVLISAPGAGKVVIVDEIQLFLDFNSAAYVAGAGEDLQFEYVTGGVDIAAIDNDAVAFLTASADAHWFGKNFGVYDAAAAASGDGVLLGTIDNEGVQVTILSGEVATGDSPIYYKIKYRIIDLLSAS